tara:strand:- start:657 stop:842 length:186 start_codon:yes stop_codon:yes gene_type:complete
MYSILDRTQFYEEIAACGMDYLPDTSYFKQVRIALENKNKKINCLLVENRKLKDQLQNNNC